MFERNTEKDIKWLERAIEESRIRIERNLELRWFEVVDGEWTDITEERNTSLQHDINRYEIVLEALRKK